MYLDELELGQKLNLLAKIGPENLEFEISVKDVDKASHSIFTDAILKDDRVISFKAKGLLVDLYMYIPDNAPRVFKNVKIKLINGKSGGFEYKISSYAEALSMNRRQNFRIYVGESIVLQCGLNHSTTDAIIKDISSAGVSFTVDESKATMKEGQVVHAVLNDRVEEISKNYSFQIYGLIIRREELENGLVTYGCKLNNHVPGLENYIMVKERIRLKKQKENER